MDPNLEPLPDFETPANKCRSSSCARSAAARSSQLPRQSKKKPNKMGKKKSFGLFRQASRGHKMADN
ncbi:hypothetical protein AWZ03_012580 [Drosophila navojoa]|uniref:Uncharacterized protein n=1 Tax=Drosophila navojoa TaxID=7232 RepID=A0A484AZI5_DRONA|nr:hypothetical protein AWZ03_012580 [Drosophila navojoa]